MNTDIKDLNKLEFRSVLLRVHLWPGLCGVKYVNTVETVISIEGDSLHPVETLCE